MRGALLVLAGCGRIGFGALDDAAPTAAPDGASGDASFATIVRGQFAQSDDGNGTKLAVTVTLTAGNAYVAAVPWSNAVNSMALSDTRSQGWTPFPRATIASGCYANLGTNAQLFLMQAQVSGTATITATQSAAGDMGLVVVEYAGIAANAHAGDDSVIAVAADSVARLDPTTTETNAVTIAFFHDSEGAGGPTPRAPLTTLYMDGFANAALAELVAPPGTWTFEADLPAGQTDACWVATALVLRAALS